jgi:hypothetical protein
VKIVVERAPFAQELGAENNLFGSESLAHVVDEPDRDGRFDHDRCRRIDPRCRFDDCFDRRGVELVGVDVVVGRRCHDHVIGPGQGLFRIERCGEMQFFCREKILELDIDNRRFALIDHLDPVG